MILQRRLSRSILASLVILMLSDGRAIGAVLYSHRNAVQLNLPVSSQYAFLESPLTASLQRNNASSGTLYFRTTQIPLSGFSREFGADAALGFRKGTVSSNINDLRVGVSYYDNVWGTYPWFNPNRDQVSFRSHEPDQGLYEQAKSRITTIVGRIDYRPNAQDSLKVWLNPEPVREADQSASRTTAFLADASFDRLVYAIGSDGSQALSWLFADLVIATTFEEVVPGGGFSAGDVNRDGFVDAADYTLVRDNLGALVVNGTGGDVNQDGVVNAADIQQWSLRYSGSDHQTLSHRIPEPSSVLITLGVLTIASARRPKLRRVD